MRGVMMGLMLALRAAAASGQTAHSLDQVPALLKMPESKRVFAEQMRGTRQADRLGPHLPDGLTAQKITALLVPVGTVAKVNVVGARSLLVRASSARAAGGPRRIPVAAATYQPVGTRPAGN